MEELFVLHLSKMAHSQRAQYWVNSFNGIQEKNN